MATVLSISAAAADDWPTVRSGMWEFNRSVENSTSPGVLQKHQTTKCTSPIDEMKKQHDDLAKRGCKFSPVEKAGNTYVYAAECNLQGLSGKSKSVLTVDGDGAYVINMESHFGAQDTKEVVQARRTGDCP